MKKRVLVSWFCLVAPGVALVLSFVVAAGFHRHPPEYSPHDPNPAVRAAAVRLTVKEHVLIEAIRDDDPDVRLLAVERLSRSVSGGAKAQALVSLLNDPHAGVRREAAWSLGEMGADAWPALKEALQDEDPRLRSGAALALTYAYWHKEPHPWPSQQPEILTILDKLVTDDDPDVRRSAQEAKRHIGR